MKYSLMILILSSFALPNLAEARGPIPIMDKKETAEWRKKSKKIKKLGQRKSAQGIGGEAVCTAKKHHSRCKLIDSDMYFLKKTPMLSENQMTDIVVENTLAAMSYQDIDHPRAQQLKQKIRTYMENQFTINDSINTGSIGSDENAEKMFHIQQSGRIMSTLMDMYQNELRGDMVLDQLQPNSKRKELDLQISKMIETMDNEILRQNQIILLMLKSETDKGFKKLSSHTANLRDRLDIDLYAANLYHRPQSKTAEEVLMGPAYKQPTNDGEPEFCVMCIGRSQK